MHNSGCYHGHLTPSNIFVKNIAQFSDVGLQTLKKIASIHSNYVNMSGFSAPEILK